MPVNDGQKITIEVEQQYHEYTERELKDLLSKLNIHDEYIGRNLNKVVNKLKKKLPIIDEKT